VAAELAAILGRELLPLDLAWPATGDGEPYPVRVESDGCSRYLGLPIDGLVNGRSPEWMRLLLLAVDQRPLDLFVDVSNFVMLDLGQPNHLFDRRRLGASGIHVRDARPGERMVTLDEEERVLEPGDVLICSGDEPVALAGLMGGEASKVAPDTTELLLEVASFHPARIRRTSARLGLRTDASARFEKHLTPTLPKDAAAHVVNLLRAECPELRLPAPAGDAGDWTDPACTVTLRPARLRAVLGLEVDDDAIASTLGGLGFGLEREGDAWSVAVPSARATKDVGLEEDLIEEVGRMHGYGSVPEAELVASVAPPPRDLRRELVRRVQDRLSGSARFHEVLSYSFHHDDLLRTVGLLDRPHMRMDNPIVDGGTRIRRSVLPSLIGVLAKNRRLTDDVRLFEVGKGYRPELLNEAGEPVELHQLALAWVAPRAAAEARFDRGTFFRLRGVVEDLLGSLGLPAPEWSAGERDAAPPYLHPGKWIHASYGGSAEPAVVLGSLEPGLVRALGLHGEQDGDVAVAELSLDGLLAADATGSTYRPLPKYPGVKVDVALAVDDATPASDVAGCILAAGKGLVADLELFDVYRGDSVGAGRKSLAYHVVLQAADKTLSDKEAAKFLGRVERGIQALGGQLRRD
jgi:phenylalanyl-tRNA synthetase beta chain